MYDGRIEGGAERGTPLVKWISRVCVGVRQLKVAGLSVLRGSVRTGRDGDTSATAIHRREVLTDINRPVFLRLETK